MSRGRADKASGKGGPGKGGPGKGATAKGATAEGTPTKGGPTKGAAKGGPTRSGPTKSGPEAGAAVPTEGGATERREPVPAGVAWVGVAVLTVAGALAGILECALVPFYLGGTIFPIAVVAAVVSNIVLPRMARRLVQSTAAAALPFVGWLAVIIAFGASGRPEGDVILPGGGSLEYVSYGVMLGGALVGTLAIVTSAPPPVPRPPRERPGGSVAARRNAPRKGPTRRRTGPGWPR